LNIVFATDHFPPEPVYGYDRWASMLSACLVDRGHQVEVVAPRNNDQLPADQTDNGVRVRRYEPARVPDKLWMFGRAIRYRGARPMLAECDRRCDILIGLPHYIQAAPRWCPSLLRVYRGGGTLLAAAPHELFRWPKDQPLHVRLAAYFSWTRMLAREKRALRVGHAVIVPSDNIRQQLAYYYKIPPSRVTVIPHGADPSRFTPVEVPMTGTLRVVTTARLDTIKNQKLLVEAAALAGCREHLHIRIAGEGALRGMLERRIAELGLEGTVELVGYQKDVEQQYQWAHVFVLPSIHEPFGISVLEAMSCGLPVIGLRTDPPEVWTANDELVEDGRSGILLDHNDPKLLAGALDEMYDHPERIAEMGREARRRAEEQFTWALSAERYESFFAELIAEAKGRQR
jgi:glycosyltransferase involved in cell wall biosynthesis